MTRRDVYGLLGIALMLGGLVWMAVLAYPFVVYRYDHPELTETQLQIRSFSMFRVWHLIPVGVLFSGLALLVIAGRKGKK